MLGENCLAQEKHGAGNSFLVTLTSSLIWSQSSVCTITRLHRKRHRLSCSQYLGCMGERHITDTLSSVFIIVVLYCICNSFMILSG